MHLIFFIQSVGMAGPIHFILTVDMFIKMLDEEQDEENEKAILGLDSESEISDAEDLDLFYRIKLDLWVNPALQNEEGSFEDIEDPNPLMKGNGQNGHTIQNGWLPVALIKLVPKTFSFSPVMKHVCTKFL